MRSKSLVVRAVSGATTLALAGLLATGAAAQGRGQGNGGSGSGGGGTGGGEAMSPDLGDLFILYRDVSGVPILTADGCQQPLAAPGVPLPAIGTIPACTPAPNQSCLVPVDPATCAVVPGYETYTQEVDFGRTSVIRSPDSVLETQLDDVIVNLATADCVSLDPAGRLVTSTVTNNVVSSAEIDSPLQNLAIYRQLMLTGYLGAAGSPLTLPAGPLITAARGFGAATDKEGKVGVDMVAYVNQILGLTDETVATVLPKKCISVKEEVQGVVQFVNKCFLDYGSFAYDRSANFDAQLPDPPYIPAGQPLPGWFEYLAVLDPSQPTFYIGNDRMATVVPELLSNPALAASNISGFASAADDARAVIEFMPSWPVPGTYPTPLTCTPSGATGYDLSISSQSGLQVPVRMVLGTEGREFILTVANAGPDAATGTAIVTATDATGAPIPTFPRSYPFTILAGGSQSWTDGFTVNYATTVTWSATAVGDFEVNPGNNTVSATTEVIGQGRGRR
jgi:hypothetical protein